MDYLRYIVNEIYTVAVATTDEHGRPVTCAIDIMDYDSNGLYFLTAKGKSFYKRLIKDKYIALTGIKGSDTMHMTAVSLRGKVCEAGSDRLGRLFEKNPYMSELYPTAESRKALTVLRIYDGEGEWFDLSKKPIERNIFTIAKDPKENVEAKAVGYFITDKCIDCGKCLDACPQSCIDKGFPKPYTIRQSNCLHCGNCAVNCPAKAVERRS